MNIGWIGTGIMGSAMCSRLIDKGYNINIFNRTKKSSIPLINRGAKWCNNPREVAKSSSIIFVMVGFPEDVREVSLGIKGILSGAKTGSTIIDMTTSSPNLAKTIFEKAIIKGVFVLDAPVSGGDIGAKNGTLAIMVGGDKKVYDKNLHLLETFGNNIKYMGKAGFGQHAKISNQILIASTMMGVVESLLYAQRVGIDLNELINIIGKGAARSWSINNLGKKIAIADYSPGFFVKHFVKDIGIALDEAERMHLCLPGLALVHQFYILAVSMGCENLGIQSLYKILKNMNTGKLL